MPDLHKEESMRWDDFRRSDNVEDDRGGGGFGGGYGGGMGGLPIGGGGLGIGTVVVLGLIGWALGIDPRVLIGGAAMMNQGRQQAPYTTPQRKTGVPKDAMGQFVSAVLGNTEDTWQAIFQADGLQYRAPKLRMFSGQVQSACGFAQSAAGPFYCPTDQRIYLDTSFFQDLQTRFHGCTNNKACEFSEAYVIAHEVGHHVQNLLGILPKIQQQQRAAANKTESNRLQVRVELQADCFAGVWANRSEKRKSFMDPGDVDQALQTASAIGDDTLQRKARGSVVPDAFTHGSAEQRKRWFMNGFNSGQTSACNTFTATQL
jgi:predicted metalloprotease